MESELAADERGSTRIRRMIRNTMEPRTAEILREAVNGLGLVEAGAEIAGSGVGVGRG